MAVSTDSFLSAHLMAASGPPSWRSALTVGVRGRAVEPVAAPDPLDAARHHLHGDDAHAGLSRGPDGRRHVRDARGLVGHGHVLHREVVGGQDDVGLSQLDQVRQHPVHVEVRADAGEPDLSGLLGDALGLEQIVGHLGRGALGVQIPDVEVVGPQLAQAGVQIASAPPAAVWLSVLLEMIDLLPPALQRRAQHALVVAVHVAARGVEVDDADVGGPLDHRLIGRRHAAERQRRHLQAGLAERAVRELDVLRRALRSGGRL